MAEREEDLKSLLMRLKEKSEKAGLKLNIQILRPWHPVPSRQGILFSSAPKSLQTVTVPMKLNDTCSLEEKLWQLQFSSVAQSCLTLFDPMNHSTPGLPVHHQLLEFTQTHVHRVGDAIQPSHPLSSPSPAPNPSQHQSLFQWFSSSHEVAKVLEFQL